jgi:hypothetical protein
MSCLVHGEDSEELGRRQGASTQVWRRLSRGDLTQPAAKGPELTCEMNQSGYYDRTFRQRDIGRENG